MARVARGTEQPRQRLPAPRAPANPARPRVRLPTQRAWLLATLRHEAAHFTNRIGHLLSDRTTAELIASVPQAVSLLRPLCHMLGVNHPAIPPGRRRRPRAVAVATRSRRRCEPLGRNAQPAAAPGRGAGQPEASPGLAREAVPPPPASPETAPCQHVLWPWFPRPSTIPRKPGAAPPDAAPAGGCARPPPPQSLRRLAGPRLDWFGPPAQRRG